MEIKCACQKSFESQHTGNDFKEFLKEAKTEFSKVREECPVLNSIVFPDKIWNKYINNEYPYDKAHHDSAFFIAFRGKILSLYTTPLHAFLLDDNNKIRKDVSKNYLKDLRESWITLESETQQIEIKMHKEGRRYFGKFFELRLAYLLSKEGYEINDLEVWGGKSDIFAVKKKEQNETGYAIEVKYIGKEDDDFKRAMDKVLGTWSQQEKANFLLYKICEAADQLKKENRKATEKTCAIIIENYSRDHFEYAMKNGFFNLNTPEFEEHEIMKDKLKTNKNQRKQDKIEAIFADPASYVECLDEVWIYMMDNVGLDFNLMYRYNVRTKQSESFI